MTIKEIKDLTKYLSDEDIEKIKQEIKSKEEILKEKNLNEEEFGQVVNTLFAILVIEKALELEIEGIEEIRDELEAELLESYHIYDKYMAMYKREKKKKKKNWLLNFLFLSDRIGSQKKGISSANKTIDSLKKELNALKQQKSNSNMTEMLNKRDKGLFKDFLRAPRRCSNPQHHHHDRILNDIMNHRRVERILRDIENGNRRRKPPAEVIRFSTTMSTVAREDASSRARPSASRTSDSGRDRGTRWM